MERIHLQFLSLSCKLNYFRYGYKGNMSSTGPNNKVCWPDPGRSWQSTRTRPKQEHKQTSPNHIQAIFSGSVQHVIWARGVIVVSHPPQEPKSLSCLLEVSAGFPVSLLIFLFFPALSEWEAKLVVGNLSKTSCIHWTLIGLTGSSSASTLIVNQIGRPHGAKRQSDRTSERARP